MQPNKELALRVLQYILDHPEEWIQDIYFCDTAACFAGRTLLLQGYRLHNALMASKDEVTAHIAHLAARELGIPTRNLLFSCFNSLSDLRYLVASIFDAPEALTLQPSRSAR